MFTAISEPIS